MSTNQKLSVLFLIILLVFTFEGCTPTKPEPTPTLVIPTDTPIPPSPTPLPLAIKVNEGGVLISDYEEELKRFNAASQVLKKTFTPEESKALVLEDLSSMELLAQAAARNGYSVSDADIDAQIAGLAQQQGGDLVFNTWLQTNFYTPESFRRAFIRSQAAAWQRDQIVKAMPATAEQVHARQIFFSREESAKNYRQQVDNGADFAVLAYQADPTTHGELGWFPRGYLLQPEVEEAAFALQPGQVSPVIKSAIGFHLVQVIDRDPAKPLTADAKSVLETQAIINWVKQARLEANIQILIP